MSYVTKTFTDDIFLENAQLHVEKAFLKEIYAEPLTLSALTVFIKKQCTSQSYPLLIDICSENIEEILQCCRNAGMKLWGMILGPQIGLKKFSEAENYSVLNPARRANLVTDNNNEISRHTLDGMRNFGIFEIEWGKFKEACLFENKSLHSLILISNDINMLSEPKLDFLYRLASNRDDKRYGKYYINWGAVACEVCHKGGMIVKIGGEFDDHYRSINIIFSQTYLKEAIKKSLVISGSSEES